MSPAESPTDRSPAAAPDACLDLRGTPCPINFVRTKLRLQQLPENALLEVWLDAGEPVEQVPHSLTVAGYPIETLEARETEGSPTFFALQVRNAIEPARAPQA